MFGFPQALDEQDMDGGAESEQAMLPSSLTLDFQETKPNGVIHSFDINSGLSVCQHLRGKRQLQGRGLWNSPYVFFYHSLCFLLHWLSNPSGNQAPTLQSGI